jgi:tRNA(Arg) A34 adenosine deaminase TadA
MRTADEYMRMAIAEAEVAARGGNAPYGAVIVGPAGDIEVAEHNRSVELSDPTAHAEMMAIRRLCAERRTLSLEGTTLYANAHPCPMCLGAILETRIARLFFGAPAPDRLWPPGSVAELTDRYGNSLQVVGSVLMDEAVRQLRSWGR